MSAPGGRIKRITNCARCGGEYHNLPMKPLTRPFAPPEASPVTWTHWFMCPSSQEPVLVRDTRVMGLTGNG